MTLQCLSDFVTFFFFLLVVMSPGNYLCPYCIKCSCGCLLISDNAIGFYVLLQTMCNSSSLLADRANTFAFPDNGIRLQLSLSLISRLFMASMLDVVVLMLVDFFLFCCPLQPFVLLQVSVNILHLLVVVTFCLPLALRTHLSTGRCELAVFIKYVTACNRAHCCPAENLNLSVAKSRAAAEVIC